MNCDDLGERLVDSWDDGLSVAERAELEQHLTGCDDCRMESEQLEAVWLELGSLDHALDVPSERLRSRFYGFLAEQQRRRETTGLRRRWVGWMESIWPHRSRPQMAWVAVALMLGIVVGLAGTGLGTSSEIRALRTELAEISERVGLSLLTHPAATERLRGVSLTDRTAGDERVVSALLDLVKNDPSVNVRLAAIEALALRIEQPGVKPRLLNTLPEQQSPLLQMTLLDVFLPADGEQVFLVAEPLLDAEGLDEAVRERLLEAKGDPA